MATKSQKVKLGIFVTGATLLLVVTLVVFAGLKLGEDKDTYFIYFTDSVSGLEVGAPVKLRGVRVGVINEIKVDPDSVEQVKVSIGLEKGTPIKKDSTAIMVFQGITGLKFIEIQDGTADSDLLPPGSNIPPGESAIDKITGRAEDLAVKAEQVMNNVLDITRPSNRRKIDSILSNTDELIKNLNALSKKTLDVLDEVEKVIDENRKPLKRAIVSVEGTSDRAERTMASVEGLVNEARATLKGLKLEETMAGLNQTNELVQQRLLNVDLSGAVQRVTVVLGALQVALERMSNVVGQNQEQLRATMYNLRIATDSLKQFSREIEEKPNRLLFSDAPEERELP